MSTARGNEESKVPIWPTFVRPVLLSLVDVDTLKRREIVDRVITSTDLSDEAMVERIASGEPRYLGRVHWAITHSNRAALVERPERATYRLTNKGRHWLSAYPHGLNSFSEANQYFHEYWQKAQEERQPDLADSPVSTELTASPEERILDAVAALNEDVQTSLLSRLQESSPTFFEQAVVELLLAMGYGGAEKRGQAVGRSNDGGIDGIIDEDPLGLDRVYVQAKRYGSRNSVGREAIQAFVGALHGQAASKGVFITTSKFTEGAREYADAVASSVILLDGVRLTNLMVKYRVGVQPKETFTVVELDEDFFE